VRLKIPFFLGYDAALLRERFQTFRGMVVTSTDVSKDVDSLKANNGIAICYALNYIEIIHK
jgi:AAA+ superfamily predicted ATPase